MNIVRSQTYATRSSTTESFTTRGDWQEQEVLRRREINRLIVAAHAGYMTPAPEGEAMSVAVEVWKDALDLAGVPNDRLREMLSRANAGRGSNYPPSVAEIAAEWRRARSEQPVKTFTETAREAEHKRLLAADDSGRGRKVWVLLRQRMESGAGNVVCECRNPAVISRDGFDWVCEREECSFVWPTSDTMSAPNGNAAGPMGGEMKTGAPPPPPEPEYVQVPELNDEELLCELSERTGFDVNKIGQQRSIEFARYFLIACPVEEWDLEMAREMWSAWTSEQKQQQQEVAV